MNSKEIKMEILSMAVEDYHGLWELLWGLRPLLREKSNEEIKISAEKA